MTYTDNADKLNKHVYAYNTLKEMIITNKLPADTNLVERQLCEMLELSRTPVRSALQELVNDNFAVNYPGRGTVVSKIQIEDFVEIFELRSALDVLAMELFLRRNDAPAVCEMRRTVEDMKSFYDAEDFASFVKADSRFHEIYFTNTGNKRLERILATISDQIRRILNLTATDRDRCTMSYRDHLAIIEAIESGDREDTLRLVKAHITGSLEYHVRKAMRM